MADVAAIGITDGTQMRSGAIPITEENRGQSGATGASPAPTQPAGFAAGTDTRLLAIGADGSSVILRNDQKKCGLGQ